MFRKTSIMARKFMTVSFVACAFIVCPGGAPDAHAVVASGLWVTPQEIDFGPVGLGATSPQAVVSITNYSAVTLNNFAGGGLSTPFNVTQDCAGGVAPGATCHYYFTFSPPTEGDFSAVSSSSSNLGNIKVTVHGTGVGAKVVYDAHALDMGSVYLGGNATPQTVTLRNVGLAPLTNFAGGGVSAPFSASQDCASGVAPGGSCHYYFNFSPAAAGSYTATSSSSTNGGQVAVSLQGSGRSFIFGSGQRVSPLSLDFGPVGVGTSSPQLKTEIHNQSPVTQITGWAGGGVATPFSASQDCASGVPAGGSCSFYYGFTPAAAGDFTATSTVSNSYGSFSIQLHGTGVAPSHNVTPLWLDFGPGTLNTTGPAQIVTITNTGLSPITGWAGGGVSPPFGAAQDCASGLPVGATCRFYYTFTPTSSGFFTAQSNVSTSAGTFRILLQGGAHPSEYSLGVNFPGTGGGMVTSSPTGINCNTDCSQPFTAGSPVTLTATAASYSVFSGWSGGCTGTDTCTVTADANKSVIATFTMDTAHKARIGSRYYPTLADAYAAASAEGSVIEASATLFNEDLACTSVKNVTIKGGYTDNYASNNSYTSLHGTLTIGLGSLTVERLIIL